MPKWCWSIPQYHKVTLKTLLKFGSTVHICIGVIFWYFLITLLDTIIHKSDSPNTSAPLMALQYFIYFFFFLPLGILLHRGVEKESVLILEWGGGSFLLLQIYGGLTQYQYGFLLSTFLSVTFPSLQMTSDLFIEIGIGLFLSFFYATLLYLYVKELRSHFYVPPVYPSRVDYFYYPSDTSANVTVFHKHVPVTIMHNYQNTAYFIQKDNNPSTSSPRRGQGACTSSPNGRIPTRKQKQVNMR